MSAQAKNKLQKAWTAREIARERRVTQERVARDRERGVTANLEDAAAFARATNVFVKAFSSGRGA